MKKKLIGALLFVLAAACIAASAKEGSREALIGGAAVALILVIIGLRMFKAAPAAKPAPVSAAKPGYQFVSFSAAGVTFKNDDGSDRQTILRHIKFMDPPYVPEGQTDADVELRPYIWEGKPAYYCIVNGYTVGSVPAVKVQAVQEALRHPDAIISGFTVTGGGQGYNYGCDIAIRYTP